MTQKEMAIEFLKMVAFGEVQAGYKKYISDDFIHHNQYFEAGKDSLLKAMLDAHKSHPNESFEPKYIYEDKETVIVHSLVKKTDMDITVVHIFKFKDNKIVEMWDVGQLIEKDVPNSDGLF